MDLLGNIRKRRKINIVIAASIVGNIKAAFGSNWNLIKGYVEIARARASPIQIGSNYLLVGLQLEICAATCKNKALSALSIFFNI